MIFHDVEQNTDEWMQLRCGKLTSSKLGVIMANYGKAFGEPAKKYAVELAIEQITGQKIESAYSNEHMERGHEQEPLARMLYEEDTFSAVDNGGFFCSDLIGCSPDGLVSDDGVIEIKSVIPSVHFANVKRCAVDPSYKWQCVGNLMFTGRKWLDFVSYCDNYPDGKKLFIFRIYAEKLTEEFKMIGERSEEFRMLVDSTKKQMLSANYFNY